MDSIKALPKKSTLVLNSSQRALGRVVSIPVADTHSANVDFDSANDLSADLFWSLYQNEPKANEDIAPERALNKRLIDWLAESPAYQTARSQTVAALLASAMSAGVMTTNLLTDESIREALVKQEQAERQEREAQGAEAAYNAAKATGQDDLAAELAENAQKAHQRAQKLLAQASDKLNEKLGQPATAAVRAKAVQAIKKAAEDAEQISAGFGLDAGNPETSQNLPAILDTLKKLPNLAELVKKIARAKALFGAKLGGKKREESHSLVRDGYTRQINAMFPSEAALLRPDAPGLLRAMKVAEFADRGVLGMISESELQERGGLVVALDSSGSMDGTRYTLACALALGITQAAQENDQDYRIFQFESYVRGGTISPDSNWQDRLGFVSVGADGGTDFDQALSAAIQHIQDLEQPENSSIVLLSDGQGWIGSDIQEQLATLRQDSNVRLIYLDVSGKPDAGVQAIASHSLVVNNLERDFDRIVSQLGEILA